MASVLQAFFSFGRHDWIALGSMFGAAFIAFVFVWDTLLILPFLYVVCGLFFINRCSDVLIDGSVRLSHIFGIPLFLVGIIVIGFGTSLPELVTSIVATMPGGLGTELVIGNIIGSNVANIALALGFSVFIAPIMLDMRDVIYDYLVVVCIYVVFSFMIFYNNSFGELDFSVIGIYESCGLLLIFIIWMIVLVSRYKKNPDIVRDAIEDEEDSDITTFSNSVLVTMGLIGLIFSAWLLLHGAVDVASYFGLSDLIIGATIIAIGTSLPEIIVSVKSSIMGKPGLLFGNLLGSCVFNILLVAGVSGMISDLLLTTEVYDHIFIYLLFMIGVLVFVFPFILMGKLSRTLGFVLITSFIIYSFFLVFGF